MSIRVLLVDDSATIRFKFKALLEKHEMQVETANNGVDALKLLEPGHEVDVVVTDLKMPGLDGEKLVKTLQSCEHLRTVPILVLTSSVERDDKLHNIEAGAAGYFTKGDMDEDIFVATIRRFAAEKQRTRGFETDSRTDPLTGLFNRRYGNERLSQELEKFARYGHAFSVALLDIDHFKHINDTLGHKAGDDVLKRLAQELRRASRASDLVMRWGGEEFLFVFPGTGLAQAAAVVERFRAQLASSPVLLEAGGSGVPVTISGGVSETQSGDTIETLVQRADQGLYKAKETGRNRLLMWQLGQLVPVVAA
jgi:two-component system cell cycle response regulator